MGVTFIIGRAGSGKTAHIMRRITDALRAEPLGPPIYWILPKQATFQAERELTAAVGAFSRVRVVSFELLGRELAVECGDAAIPEVTPVGRLLIFGHLLRKHREELAYFRSVAHRPGLAAELDATFAEFERSGQTTEALDDLIDQLRHADPTDAQGPSLQAKLRDLRLLYDAYQAFLGQDRLDQHRRLQLVRDRLRGCSQLRGARVYVDAFHAFSNYEREVLVGLAQASAGVEVALLMDPDSPSVRDPHHKPAELDLLHRTEQTYQRLWFAMNAENVAINEPVLLRGGERFKAEALARVERDTFAEGAEQPKARPESVQRPTSDSGAGVGLFDAVFRASLIVEGGTLGDERAFPSSLTPAIAFIEAPDPQAEVDAVARGIGRLLRDGMRLRDIGVIARDLDAYQTVIENSFREHGIGFFADRRRSATHHPLLLFVQSLFQVARGEWPQLAVLSLLRTGLAGATLPEADEVENYLIQHRVGGKAWEDATDWAYQKQLNGDSVDDDEALPAEPLAARSVDAIRRAIAERIAPFVALVRRGERLPVRAWAVGVFEVFERFKVRAAIAGWAQEANASGDLEGAAEHERVWAELVNLFEQMVDLLGDETMAAGDFLDVLSARLEQFDLALTPPTVDQVLVGQADRTRTPPLRAVFVLGLNEGQFPHVHREASILSHDERQELRRRNVELDADAQRRQLDERFLGYVAFTRASERLIVTRSLADASGKPTEPSAFWNRLRAVVPDDPPTRVPRESGHDAAHVATPRQLVTCLMEWGRCAERGSEGQGERGRNAEAANADSRSVSPTPPLPLSPSALPALYNWLAGGEVSAAIAALRDQAWPALRYDNVARLSPDVATQLFPAPLGATAGQLEAFAACPFKHFARYGLRLTQREAAGVTAIDMSQIFHDVLEVVVRQMLEAGKDWKDLTPADAAAMVRAQSASVAKRLRGELMLSNARNKYLLGRIERTLGQVVASIRETIARGRFQPRHAGVRFGDGKGLGSHEVPTPSGRAVRLSGQIDRVDLLTEGEDAGTLAVVDYKLGGASLSLGSLYHGLSLQLLTYLLVLQCNGETLAGRPLTPAAAFYVRLLRGIESVKHPDDAPDATSPDYHLRHKPRGVFDGKFLAALDAELGAGQRSKVVSAHLKNDGQFGSKHASDVADAREFAALLTFVREQIGRLGDDVMSGKIDIAPYRIGKATPCPQCDYRAVCRFEPLVNGYRFLPPLRRLDVLNALVGVAPTQGADGGNNGIA